MTDMLSVEFNAMEDNSRAAECARVVAEERIVRWDHHGPALRHVAGVIIYIASEDSILTYLRDDNPLISHPNTVNFFGGMCDEGENLEEAVRREVAEELADAVSNEPYQIGMLNELTQLQDQRGVEFTLFWSEVDTLPQLKLDDGGQEIIKVSRNDALSGDIRTNDGQPTEFSLDYLELARGFFRTHPVKRS